MHEIDSGRSLSEPNQARRADPRRDIRLASIAGMATILVLFGTVGIWAATAQLSGAVIAAGTVVVETNVRRIQHPTGGVVADIRVRDGDHVAAGDVLVSLDATEARAALALIDVELLSLQIGKARLEAERDSLAMISFPEELRSRSREPSVAKMLHTEERLFATRYAAADVQRSQLRQRIVQANEEIVGLVAQVEAKQNELTLVGKELEGIQPLYEQKLVQVTRLITLQRESAQLEGEVGSLLADIARTRGSIAEIELQIVQIDEDMRREVMTELREVDGKIADLNEHRTSASDQLDRIDLRAPEAGVVHTLSVHTIGGVIAPGEQVMLIVPETDQLVVEARVEPALVDRMHIGQMATLRFPAFDSATTPELNGELVHLAADATTDPQSGVSYYLVRLALRWPEVQRLDGKALLPGMPAEVYLQTSSRTAIGYLVKPISDQLSRTFRYD